MASELKYLEILVLLRENSKRWSPEYLEQALKPLWQLRNIEEFQVLNCGLLEDWPDFGFPPSDISGDYLPSLDDQDEVVARLKQLMQVKTPVEFLQKKLNLRLETYLHSFERDSGYESVDDSTGSRFIYVEPKVGACKSVLHQDYFGYTYYRNGADNHGHCFPSRRIDTNNRWGYHDEPSTTWDEAIYFWKTIRSSNLTYLEPRYQRIQSAADAMGNFIKEHKQDNELLDPSQRRFVSPFVHRYRGTSYLNGMDVGIKFANRLHERNQSLGQSKA